MDFIDWSENIHCADKDLSTRKDNCCNIVFPGEHNIGKGQAITFGRERKVGRQKKILQGFARNLDILRRFL